MSTTTAAPIVETTVASGGTKVERRGLTDVVYHVFDTPGKHTFKVKSTIPAFEYLVVGATGGCPRGSGGGGAVVTSASAKALEPGEYEVEVGAMGGRLETKVTMVPCNQNVCKQTPYTQHMNFPNGAYNGVPSGTYLSCGGIQSTPTKMTEEVYGAGGKSSFLNSTANGGGPGAIKPSMVSNWDWTINYGKADISRPNSQYDYAFGAAYNPPSGGRYFGNPAYVSYSCGQFDLNYVAGKSGTGHNGTSFQNCCAGQHQRSDPNCCVNAGGGAGGAASRPGARQAKPGPGVMSSITGTAVEYGHGAGGNVEAKTAKHGIVIIAYDLSKAEAIMDQNQIDVIIAEYNLKVSKLKEVMAAEKQALLDENTVAATTAKAAQDALVAELTTLKATYDALHAKATPMMSQIESIQQELVSIKSEYEAKITALTAARQQEVDALNAQNAAAGAAAQAEQGRLTSELAALKSRYDALAKNVSDCPIIPDGTVAVDGGTGQLFKFQSGSLRPMSMETYRALGSPNYTTYPSGTLTSCPRGPPVVAEASTTVPPVTNAPSTDPVFPGTLYVIVHADSWLRSQQLRVLASRFGTLGVEPFQFKALEQVFVINNAGYVRNVAGDGLYLTNAGDCLSPVMSKDVPLSPWRISRAGDSPLEYTLVSSCGASLKASLGAQAAILEQGVFGSEVSENWYIVPVGRAQV